jgi:Uma2 family endonuclease
MGMPLPKMTLAEYMAREAEQPDPHELHRGETFAMVGGTRTIKVFTLTDSGAWLLTDQTDLGTLTLAGIDCKLPLEWVFKGMDRDPA